MNWGDSDFVIPHAWPTLRQEQSSTSSSPFTQNLSLTHNLSDRWSGKRSGVWRSVAAVLRAVEPHLTSP